MVYMTDIEQVLKYQKYVPVVTFEETDDVGRFADFLLDQGVSCIEVTLRTPFAMQAIRDLKNAYKDRLVIGAGTSNPCASNRGTEENRGDFIVCPGLIKELFEAASKASIPFLPGVATPTEIMNARAWGIKWLKFFPANVNGGAIALKAYASVFARCQVLSNRAGYRENRVLNIWIYPMYSPSEVPGFKRNFPTSKTQ